jgi:spore coat protein U-like protein
MAASTSSHLEISAEVSSNCKIVVSDLSFGAYDPLEAHSKRELDASAAVNVLCTRGSRASVYLDSGRNTAGSTRALSSGTDLLRYEIYSDSDRTRQWSTDGRVTIVAASSRSASQFIVYGRIPSGQEVPSGPYTDVVMATVDF